METKPSKSAAPDVRGLVHTALGAALIAVCAWLSIPAAVPFTMQTFAVFLCCGLLGGRRGTVCVLVYLLLGAIGLPVFASFTGGAGVLFGPTGGYLLGFLLCALLMWLLARLLPRTLPALAVAMLAGLLACYAFGTAWFTIVSARANGPVGLATALSWCVVPYLLPDLTKLALALLLTRRLAPLLHRSPAA